VKLSILNFSLYGVYTRCLRRDVDHGGSGCDSIAILINSARVTIKNHVVTHNHVHMRHVHVHAHAHAHVHAHVHAHAHVHVHVLHVHVCA